MTLHKSVVYGLAIEASQGICRCRLPFLLA